MNCMQYLYVSLHRTPGRGGSLGTPAAMLLTPQAAKTPNPAAAAADDLQEGGLEAGQATAEGGKAAKRKKSKLGGASGGAARNVPVFFSPNDSIPPFQILPYVLICSLNSLLIFGEPWYSYQRIA